MEQYRWTDLQPLVRQYVVKDDNGRLGIATEQAGRTDVLFVRPAGTPNTIDAPAEIGLHAIISTETPFRRSGDIYVGMWFDTSQVVNLTIIDDLGWVIPDDIADSLLTGSHMIGWWDTHQLQVVTTRRQPGYMTIPDAATYAREVGVSLSEVGIRKAARAGNIPGAYRAGRDWMIPYDGYNQYLDNRPRRGRK